MINATNPYQMYQQTRVETANPLQLVVMLYDGALRFSHQAKKAMEEKDIQKTNYYLLRTQDIVNELLVSLDPEAGEISQNLERLYEYINYSLLQANLNKDIVMLDNAISVLTTLRSAWMELRPNVQKVVGGA